MDRTPPGRRLSPLLLAAAALGAMALTVVVVFATAGPLTSRSPGESTTASFEAAAASLELLQPGDAVELPALDAHGQWGTIRIVRGEDLGGYQDAAIDPETFVIELFIDYTAARYPQPEQFGEANWLLRPADVDAELSASRGPTRYERTAGPGFRPEMPLGMYPGAIEILSTPTEGRIAFEVLRDEADLELVLAYAPDGLAEAATILVREPGPPPEAVAVRPPQASPEPPDHVAQDGLGITVAESAEADALFARSDTCENPDAGFAVAYPDDWYTNTEIGDVPACSWFTPEFFEVPDPSVVPGEIWISIRLIPGPVGYIGTTETFSTDEVVIDGRSATRSEFNPMPMFTPSYRQYHYRIPVTGDEFGPSLLASTDTDMADDYELSRAVLDRIMASLTWDD